MNRKDEMKLIQFWSQNGRRPSPHVGGGDDDNNEIQKGRQFKNLKWKIRKSREVCLGLPNADPNKHSSELYLDVLTKAHDDPLRYGCLLEYSKGGVIPGQSRRLKKKELLKQQQQQQVEAAAAAAAAAAKKQQEQNRQQSAKEARRRRISIRRDERRRQEEVRRRRSQQGRRQKGEEEEDEEGGRGGQDKDGGGGDIAQQQLLQVAERAYEGDVERSPVSVVVPTRIVQDDPVAVQPPSAVASALQEEVITEEQPQPQQQQVGGDGNVGGTRNHEKQQSEEDEEESSGQGESSRQEKVEDDEEHGDGGMVAEMLGRDDDDDEIEQEGNLQVQQQHQHQPRNLSIIGNNNDINNSHDGGGGGGRRRPRSCPRCKNSTNGLTIGDGTRRVSTESYNNAAQCRIEYLESLLEEAGKVIYEHEPHHRLALQPVQQQQQHYQQQQQQDDDKDDEDDDEEEILGDGGGNVPVQGDIAAGAAVAVPAEVANDVAVAEVAQHPQPPPQEEEHEEEEGGEEEEDEIEEEVVPDIFASGDLDGRPFHQHRQDFLDEQGVFRVQDDIELLNDDANEVMDNGEDGDEEEEAGAPHPAVAAPGIGMDVHIAWALRQMNRRVYQQRREESVVRTESLRNIQTLIGALITELHQDQDEESEYRQLLHEHHYGWNGSNLHPLRPHPDQLRNVHAVRGIIPVRPPVPAVPSYNTIPGVQAIVEELQRLGSESNPYQH